MSQRGMTLLEVLLAVTISTLVLGSAFWLLSSGMDAERRAEERTLWQQEYFVLAKRLRTELTGAFYSPLFPQSFQGETEKVQFCYPTSKGLAQVLWESRTDGIYYSRKEPGAPRWNPAIKLAGSWQGKFSYLDQDGGWRNSWHSEEEQALPQLVRLELSGKGRRQLAITLEGGRVIPY